MAQQKKHTTDNQRRKFVTNLSIGTAAIVATPMLGRAERIFNLSNTYTVGQIMDMFISTVPGAPFPNTVDTLKAGNRDIVVTGIVTSMFATIEVINKAINLGANFIIVHEPTFYNNTDDVSWLQDDEVYRYKSDLLKKNNIAVWRNHDTIHHLVPDGVIAGVVDQLGWKKYQDGKNTFTFTPVITLQALIAQTKEKLNIKMVRYIGDLSQPCSKILFMPGSGGGKGQIGSIKMIKPDVLVCGEIAEWETAEYVRDAHSAGRKLALVVLGHIASEEPGSEFMAQWLKAKITEFKTTHIPCNNSLSFI